MPTTGLKIVGTGACLPWCSISSYFQNSLKTSGHWNYEFLEFWCWNLVPFLPGIGFQLLKSLWSYFYFNDAPNIFYWCKIWTASRPIQHPDSSSMKPCCCISCSMWFCIVLLKYTRPSLKWTSSGGNICCSKTFIYLSAYIVPSKKCKLPILYTFMQSIPSEMLPFELNAENTLEDLLYSLARRTRCLWFPTRMSNLDLFDHKTLFHFETVHFKWAFAHRTWQRFWTMFTYGPFCMIEL